jgi:hypothetical protein
MNVVHRDDRLVHDVSPAQGIAVGILN